MDIQRHRNGFFLAACVIEREYRGVMPLAIQSRCREPAALRRERDCPCCVGCSAFIRHKRRLVFPRDVKRDATDVA